MLWKQTEGYYTNLALNFDGKLADTSVKLTNLKTLLVKSKTDFKK